MLIVSILVASTLITLTHQRQIIPSTNEVIAHDKYNEFPSDGMQADEFPYLQKSIPARIFECVTQFSILKCTKLFVLQKFEDGKNIPSTGNLTQDFFNQFFGEDDRLGSLIHGKLANISDAELTQRLIVNFQKFFNNRDIKLHFLPGIMVKIIPSRDNKLKLSFRKKNKYIDDQFTGRERVGSGIKKKKGAIKFKKAIIQLAVPAMVMPAILLGSFLPFLLPVLKMATIMSVVLNNSAFIAALIYAARTHANSQIEHPVSYGHP